MSVYSNFRIGTKLILTVMIVVLLLVGLGVFALYQLGQVYDTATEIETVWLPNTRYSAELDTLMISYRAAQLEHLLATTQDTQNRLEKSMAETLVKMDETKQAYQPRISTAEEQQAFDRFDELWGAYLVRTKEITMFSRQLQREVAVVRLLNGDLKNSFTEASEALNKITEINVQGATTASQNGKTTYEVSRAMILVAMLASAVLAIFLALVSARGITLPLAKAVRMIQEMSQGNLQLRLKMDRKDEIGVMAEAMDGFADDLQGVVVGAMQRIAAGDLSIEVQPKGLQDEITPALIQTLDSLRGLVAETNLLTQAAREGRVMVRANADQFQGGYHDIIQGFNDTLNLLVEPLKMIVEAVANLNSSSAEILAATTQQASGAIEQSSAVSETSTTVEEVKVITEQALQRAQEVSMVAQNAVEVSQMGQNAVEETITSMARIKQRVEGIAANILALSKQTQQIGQIIATVNDIAAQSNMLALNASVEAARAGEHGRSFSVVAGEVRALAEQSRQATAQVKAILSEIQKATNATVMATEEGSKGVEQGMKLAEQAQASIQQLMETISTSAQAAQQLSAGGQQQRTGMDQISIAMQNINTATVQGMASTRQTEKSAQGLNEMSQRMAAAIRRYRLN